VLQAVMRLAQGLRCSREAVLWCKERAARAGDRAAALVPALQELERAVLAPGQGVEVRLMESISIMLVQLAKVWLLLVWCSGSALSELVPLAQHRYVPLVPLAGASCAAP
jgi:hypothetical protein